MIYTSNIIISANTATAREAEAREAEAREAEAREAEAREAEAIEAEAIEAERAARLFYSSSLSVLYKPPVQIEPRSL